MIFTGLRATDETELNSSTSPRSIEFEDWTSANRRWMKYVRVVRGNRLRLCLTLKCGDLLPKMIQHGIRRRVPVVRPPVHLTAGDDVDAGDFLLQDRRLGRPHLGVGEIPRRHLARGHQPIECLVPAPEVRYRRQSQSWCSLDSAA